MLAYSLTRRSGEPDSEARGLATHVKRVRYPFPIPVGMSVQSCTTYTYWYSGPLMCSFALCPLSQTTNLFWAKCDKMANLEQPQLAHGACCEEVLASRRGL